jgi:hypothetical protein
MITDIKNVRGLIEFLEQLDGDSRVFIAAASATHRSRGIGHVRMELSDIRRSHQVAQHSATSPADVNDQPNTRDHIRANHRARAVTVHLVIATT